MSGMPGVEQITVVGLFKRERNATHPMAHVYLEDKQGRWWFGAQASTKMEWWSLMNLRYPNCVAMETIGGGWLVCAWSSVGPVETV